MPILERRRIYRSGRSSFAITLPPGWIRFLKLSPGDYLELVVDEEIVLRVADRTVEESQVKAVL